MKCPSMVFGPKMRVSRGSCEYENFDNAKIRLDQTVSQTREIWNHQKLLSLAFPRHCGTRKKDTRVSSRQEFFLLSRAVLASCELRLRCKTVSTILRLMFYLLGQCVVLRQHIIISQLCDFSTDATNWLLAIRCNNTVFDVKH